MRHTNAKVLQDIDAPHYRYWQALYRCFFSSKLYVDVGKRWKGLSILYLLIVILVVSLPVSLRLMVNFHHYFNQQVMLPYQLLPPFIVQNGLVSFDKPMPLLIKNDLGQVVAIIDTTGKSKIIDKKYPHLTILVTKNALLYHAPPPPMVFQGAIPKDNPVTTRVFDNTMNQVFDAKSWLQSSHMSTVETAIGIMIYPTIALLLFFIYLVILLAFSLMAQLAAKVLLKYDITWMQAVRLLIVAATPQIVLLAILLACNTLFFGVSLLLIILLVVYFSFAVLSLRHTGNQLVMH